MISPTGHVEVFARPELKESLAKAGALTDRDPEDWGAVERTSYAGRGRPVLLRLPDTAPIVVKTMRHGGLLAILTGSRFLGSRRLTRTMAIIEHLIQRGVSTPICAFGRVRRHRWFRPLCRLDLGTEELENSRDLLAVLHTRPAANVVSRLAYQLGEIVRAMHDAGVFHADLNLKNVLVGDPASAGLMLIDWEGSRVMPRLSDADVIANLERLFRSAYKHGLIGAVVGGGQGLAFMRGYEPGRRRRRELTRRVLRRFHRRLPFHRAGWRLGGHSPHPSP